MNKNEVLEMFFTSVSAVCVAALPPETLQQVRIALTNEETALRIVCTIQKDTPGRIVGALYRPDSEPQLLFDVTPQEGDQT